MFLQSIESNWRTGHFLLQRINCRSENSKGVYCLQYDDNKIVSGLRDNTIKIWDRNTLECVKVTNFSILKMKYIKMLSLGINWSYRISFMFTI